MSMAAAEGQIRKGASSVLFRREGDPVGTSAVMNEHGPREGASLRVWRGAVFGGIGVLYLVSLWAPSVREALARVFSYFPQ
jgi:hypothetical protein